MVDKNKLYVVALEEHYWDADLVAMYPGKEGKRLSDVEQRLLDLGGVRIREMDEAGIDLQVLSHGAPGVHKMEAELAIKMAKQTNDRLKKIIDGNRTRFSGFAMLPAAGPEAAADELERAVTGLGLKGAMIHGLTNGKFIDEKQFWPIFERAEKLDVPVYLHPSFPHPAVTEAYYKDYAASYPEILGPALGFTNETATQVVRMILSGIFEKYPKLKIVVGHLGEGIPFLLWRIDQSFSRPGNSGGSFKDTFRKNFYLTTSGNFSDTALTCSISEMGVDHIMFSVDWPFIGNDIGTSWLHKTSLSDTDKAKIFGGNAKTLLKL